MKEVALCTGSCALLVSEVSLIGSSLPAALPKMLFYIRNFALYTCGRNGTPDCSLSSGWLDADCCLLEQLEMDKCFLGKCCILESMISI